VLARGATCDTNAIYIVSINGITRKEGLWGSNLVADDPPTHLVILRTASSISDSLTAARGGGSSPTHPLWAGLLPPHRGTLLGGVRHVEVGYTSPASCPVTDGLAGLAGWVALQDRYY